MKKLIALMLAAMLLLTTATAAFAEEPVTALWLTTKNPMGLDPTSTKGGFETYAACVWGDALLYCNAEQQIEGRLAESWEISDDYSEWVFHIREGVTFQDGNPLKMEDVAYSYQRHIDNPTSYNTLITSAMDGTSFDEEARTVTFHMFACNPGVYEAFSLYPIIEKAAHEADPEHYYDTPIGTGAFKVAGYDAVNGIVTFERNDDYWGWDYYGKKSNVDVLTLKSVSELATRVNSLRSGEASVIDGVTVDYFDTLTSDGLTVTSIDGGGMDQLQLYCAEGHPMYDKYLREALNYCIDRETMCTYIAGAGHAFDYPVQEGWMGYVADTGLYAYDVEKAKEALAQSNYNGETLELITCPQYVQSASELAQAIQAYASAIGININISLLEGAEYQEREKGGDYDIDLMSWNGSFFENYKFFYEFLGIDMWNHGYVNEELSSLGVELSTLMGREESIEVRSKLWEILTTEYAPHLYLFSTYIAFATQANVTGVSTTPLMYYDMRFITVE